MYQTAVVSERRWPFVLTASAGIAVVWIVGIIAHVPSNYRQWVLSWYQHIVERGQITAFSEPFGNYTPPYLYLLSASTLLPMPPFFAIKVLSCLGAVWLGFSVYQLLDAAGVNRPTEMSLWSMFLPTIVLNGPVLAQADMFWCAPAVLAVASAARERSAQMAIWAGVAFAFKAQAAFVAPFVAATLITQRARWFCWFIPAGVYVAMMFPAWLVGWPAYDLLTVYWRQIAWVPPSGIPFVSDAASPWTTFALINHDLALQYLWIGYIAAAIAAGLFVWRVWPKSPELIAIAAFVSAALVPFILPKMHERFFALAEVLAFCVAVIDRRFGPAAMLMQLSCAMSVGGWLLGHREWMFFAWVPIAVALGSICWLDSERMSSLLAARPSIRLLRQTQPKADSPES